MPQSIPDFVHAAALEAAGSSREIYKPHRQACVFTTPNGWFIQPPTHKAPANSKLVATVRAKPVVTKEEWE